MSDTLTGVGKRGEGKRVRAVVPIGDGVGRWVNVEERDGGFQRPGFLSAYPVIPNIMRSTCQSNHKPVGIAVHVRPVDSLEMR